MFPFPPLFVSLRTTRSLSSCTECQRLASTKYLNTPRETLKHQPSFSRTPFLFRLHLHHPNFFFFIIFPPGPPAPFRFFCCFCTRAASSASRASSSADLTHHTVFTSPQLDILTLTPDSFLPLPGVRLLPTHATSFSSRNAMIYLGVLHDSYPPGTKACETLVYACLTTYDISENPHYRMATSYRTSPRHSHTETNVSLLSKKRLCCHALAYHKNLS